MQLTTKVRHSDKLLDPTEPSLLRLKNQTTAISKEAVRNHTLWSC